MKPPPQFITEECRSCGGKRKRLNGAWLQAQRKARGLRLREVATALKVTPGYISDIEHGRRYVPRVDVKKFLLVVVPKRTLRESELKAERRRLFLRLERQGRR